MTLMVIFSGILLFHLLLRSVNILSFMISWSWISRLGLGVSFGMVGYLSSLELMVVLLGLLPLMRVLLVFWKVRLRSILLERQLPADFDVDSAALRVADNPDVWTDGSLIDDKSSGVSSAAAVCFTFRDRRLWSHWNWGHLDGDVRDNSVASACRGFCSVPGPLQTVQRAELWGIILALQASSSVHLGVDNLE